MAQGPIRVVLPEPPPCQNEAGIAVGQARGPAGLSEPGEQGFDGEVLAEGPGREPLDLELAGVPSGGVLVEQGADPLVGNDVALHGFPER